MLVPLSFTWLAVVCWLALRAWRQRQVLQPLKILSRMSRDETPTICVIVPARDESDNIAICVRSLLAQTIAGDRLRIIVVDDASTDDTADIVAGIATDDPLVTLIRSPELPLGWKGKVNACRLGADVAGNNAEWLCFVDADMRMHPALLASALASAVDRDIDLLSLAPRHELVSFAERLMLPCGHYTLAFCQDLSQVQSPDSDEAVATGQFMLFRREAYEAVGGHAAVRSAICEDTALARLVKRQGGKVLLQDGSKLLATRMYTGWRSLWPGIAKNLNEMLGGPARTVAIASAAVVLAWATVLLPTFSIAACTAGADAGCWAIAPALLASSLAFAFHVAGAAYFGIPLFYGFLFPLGYSAGALIALDSLWSHLTGRVRWKGRVYS